MSVDRIKIAEEATRASMAALHQAVRDTFRECTLVRANDAHGWHTWTVRSTEGENLVVSRGECKPVRRKYTSVELV